MKYGASAAACVSARAPSKTPSNSNVQTSATAWPRRHLNRIFERFYRVDKKPALAIRPARSASPSSSNRLAHGRHDSVETANLGAGATFLLHPPLAPIANPPGSRPAKIADKGRSISSTRSF